MTNIECLHQAGREMGLTEEEIQNRTKRTEARNPTLLSVMYETVPVEEERERIESFKYWFNIVEGMPSSIRQALSAEFSKRRTQNN